MKQTTNHTSTRRRPRAFTLVEILTVLALILILILALVPLLDQAMSKGYQAECASNLAQIQVASGLWEADRSHESKTEARRRFDVESWPGLLAPYLQGDPESDSAVMSQVLFCPEDEHSTANDPYDFQIEVYRNGSLLYWIDFDSPAVVKMSDTQYQNNPPVERQRLDHPGYVDDGEPNHFWLCFEDLIDGSGNPTGDMDFDDVMGEVWVKGNTISFAFERGSAGYRHKLVTKDTHQDLLGGYIPSGSPSSIDYVWAQSSYGMNLDFDRSLRGDKILVMDFDEVVVDPYEPWIDYYGPDGRLSFARHEGTINAITKSGSVRNVVGDQVNPEIPTIRKNLWQR